MRKYLSQLERGRERRGEEREGGRKGGREGGREVMLSADGGYNQGTNMAFQDPRFYTSCSMLRCKCKPICWIWASDVTARMSLVKLPSLRP